MYFILIFTLTNAIPVHSDLDNRSLSPFGTPIGSLHSNEEIEITPEDWMDTLEALKSEDGSQEEEWKRIAQSLEDMYQQNGKGIHNEYNSKSPSIVS